MDSTIIVLLAIYRALPVHHQRRTVKPEAANPVMSTRAELPVFVSAHARLDNTILDQLVSLARQGAAFVMVFRQSPAHQSLNQCVPLATHLITKL